MQATCFGNQHGQDGKKLKRALKNFKQHFLNILAVAFLYIFAPFQFCRIDYGTPDQNQAISKYFTFVTYTPQQ